VGACVVTAGASVKAWVDVPAPHADSTIAINIITASETYVLFLIMFSSRFH
jgi:hypothetical protein